MLVNPFTGQVLNANPKGCNQHSGPECSESVPDLPQQLKQVKKLVKEAKKKAQEASAGVKGSIYSKSLATREQELRAKEKDAYDRLSELEGHEMKIKNAIEGPVKPSWKHVIRAEDYPNR